MRARRNHRSGIAGCMAVLMLAMPPVLAQSEVYKCTDGSRVTYSSTVCDKLGLKSAGAISDRLTVISGDQPAARPAQAKAAPEDEEQKARKAAAGMKPVNPLVEQLLK